MLLKTENSGEQDKEHSKEWIVKTSPGYFSSHENLDPGVSLPEHSVLYVSYCNLSLPGVRPSVRNFLKYLLL